MKPAVKRPYDSSRRREQARQTRREILRAAHELFVTRGYGRTTIAEVAAAAGVSAETIYAAFGSKAALLHRVWDVTVGGDDAEIKYHERPEIMALRAEPDLAARLRGQAVVSTALARRITPFVMAVRAAAASEPAAAELVAEMDRQRYAGLAVMAREAAATGQLKVDPQEAHDVIWATTDGSLWHRLVVGRGWTDERYATWLAEVWISALVVGADRSD